MKKRIVVGLSGASGAPLAVDALELLHNQTDWETHLVYTPGFAETLRCETDFKMEQVLQTADFVYPLDQMGAAISSGTFQTEGMLIIPCSMKTVAGIASGYCDNLLLRAADVTMKEGRRLVLVPRETPMSRIHLRNLSALSELGVRILPPMMTFYIRPTSVQDMVRHITAKALAEFGIEAPGFQRWS